MNTPSAPEAAKPILEKIEKKFGKSMNIFNTMADQPEVLEGVTTINNGLQKDLPEKYRELAYFKASHMNKCEYCSHYHKQAAQQAGVSNEQLDAIGSYSSSDMFDDQEKAILKYVEQLTRDANVDSETVRIKRNHSNQKHYRTFHKSEV